MSCNGNRHAYFAAVSSSQSAAAQAFGGPEEAKQALEELFELGRNGPRPPAEATLAEAHTRLMFQQMLQQGIRPPTHSASGLPKPDARFGYALTQRTLAALERGEPLPMQARDLLLATDRKRQISSLESDTRGRVRCKSCGQYASPIRGHTCPRTATSQALRRSLMRRLGVPASAFPDAQLAALLEAARAGDVAMQHPSTGEIVQVSLDALPLAMGNGFVPELWSETGKRVVTPTGTVLTVIDGSGLAEPKPIAVPLHIVGESERRDYQAVASAAADFGLHLTPDMPIIGTSAMGMADASSQSFAYGSDPTRAYQVRYRVIDLDELIPSNLDSGAINPNYDVALQPRQRDRVASQAQIAKVAQTLTPDALLTDFKQLDKGTPILGPEDRCVESGNGRVLALRKARESFPDQWNAYQERLGQVASTFGIDPTELRGMRSPILVRERTETVDRAAFAREANAPPVLQMSTLENARVDARRLSDESLLRLTVKEDQSIDLALRANGNRPFVRDFMQTLPENERATMMRADGTLNQQGIWRIKAALFTRVFPGEAGGRLAETFTEALDSTTKNFEQAVAGTLPALVRAQSRISSGQRSAELDLSADMAASLDMLARLREQDMPVSVYLEQSSLFERELTPFQETMLRQFDAIGRKPKAIRGFLNAYAQAIEDAPDPNQVDMFGGAGLSKEQLFFRIAQATESASALAAAAA